MSISYKSYYKENLILAFPIVISQIGHMAVHIAGSIIVGQFAGTIQLAAVSLVNSLFSVIIVIGIGMSYGLTPLIAKANGSKNYDECGRLFSTSLFINVITGILLYLITHFGALSVIGRLNQTPEVVTYAKPYLGLSAFSVIPLMIFQTFRQFAEGLGFTKQAMLISVAGNLINIIIGIVLVKGMFGITPMGVKGIGISALLDRCLMAFVMGAYVFNSKHFKLYLKDFKLYVSDKVRSIQVIKIGMPVAMQYVFEVSAFGGAAIIIGTLGAAPQAAHQIAISCASVTYMMSSGIASAATIKAGTYLGQRSLIDLRRSAIASYHVIIALMCITALLFIGSSHLLPYIFTTDAKVVNIAGFLLIIAGFFQLFDGMQVVGLGILRGINDVNIPTVFTFLSYWLIGIPLGYFLGIHLTMGVKGIWYGLTIALLTASTLLFYRFRQKTKMLI